MLILIALVLVPAAALGLVLGMDRVEDSLLRPAAEPEPAPQATVPAQATHAAPAPARVAA